MAKLGLHKQWANRPLEWQQNIKVVVTATEWDNFFNLRLDSATVQPEMVKLARLMQIEIGKSNPLVLEVGEWHLPYITTERNTRTQTLEYLADGVPLTMEAAATVSVSCCAQVSYRNMDMSLLKARKIVERLADRDDPHLSPFEHQATPMQLESDTGELNPFTFQKGVTHIDSEWKLWSGNFKGWIQNRQLMET